MHAEESRRKHAEEDYANAIKLNTELQESLSQRTTDVASFKLILSQKELEIQSLNTEISQRTAQVSSLELSTGELKRQAEEACQNLQQQLESLREAVVHKEEELAKMKQTLETRSSDIDKLREAEEALRVASTTDMEVMAQTPRAAQLLFYHTSCLSALVVKLSCLSPAMPLYFAQVFFPVQLVMQQPEVDAQAPRRHDAHLPKCLLLCVFTFAIIEI
jgi:hypothetical protein